MSAHHVVHDPGAQSVVFTDEQPRQSAGPVILFIGAVLIAGLTCILYLWQQSRIVSTQQDIHALDAKYSALLVQENNLAAEVNSVRSVTRVVAEASKNGMVMGNPSLMKQLTVRMAPPSTSSLVAQNRPSHQSSSVVLPSTNAAITSWWQGAWDGLFSVVQ